MVAMSPRNDFARNYPVGHPTHFLICAQVGKPNETVAVSNLSLRVELGELIGLLGANGAGKTSAINVVMRAAFPTAGDALVRGHSVLDDFKRASTHLGVVTQTDTLYAVHKSSSESGAQFFTKVISRRRRGRAGSVER